MQSLRNSRSVHNSLTVVDLTRIAPQACRPTMTRKWHGMQPESAINHAAVSRPVHATSSSTKGLRFPPFFSPRCFLSRSCGVKGELFLKPEKGEVPVTLRAGPNRQKLDVHRTFASSEIVLLASFFFFMTRFLSVRCFPILSVPFSAPAFTFDYPEPSHSHWLHIRGRNFGGALPPTRAARRTDRENSTDEAFFPTTCPSYPTALSSSFPSRK
ncbi:hypothetical protein MTO96_017181 [Rhipicephalus appendiculatus]